MGDRILRFKVGPRKIKNLTPSYCFPVIVDLLHLLIYLLIDLPIKFYEYLLQLDDNRI